MTPVMVLFLLPQIVYLALGFRHFIEELLIAGIIHFAGIAYVNRIHKIEITHAPFRSRVLVAVFAI